MVSLNGSRIGFIILLILALPLFSSGCVGQITPVSSPTLQTLSDLKSATAVETSTLFMIPPTRIIEPTSVAPPSATTPVKPPTLVAGTAAAPSEVFPTQTATSTPLPGPCELAQDLLPAQETTRLPGEYFTHVWRLRNTGSCTWANNYAIAWSSGESFNSPLTIEIGASVSPGEVVELNVPMLAPEVSGDFVGVWAFVNPRGQRVDIAARSDDLLALSVRVRFNLTPSATVVTGGISGRVTRNGVPVPAGVAILLEDQAENIVMSTATNQDGKFTINNAPISSPGYNVVFSQELNPQYLNGQVVGWARLGPVPLTAGGLVSLPDLEIDPLDFALASPVPNAVVSAAAIAPTSPLRFEWYPYPVANSYWVNLTRGDRQFTVWASGLTSLTSALFDGVLSDGTHIQNGDFWWGVGAQRSLSGYTLTVFSPMIPLVVVP